MKITQVYDIVNAATKMVLGETAVLNEDLSNVVEIGKEILLDNERTTKWLGNINDKIGKMIFVDRLYAGRAPSVLMDAWEFGSIVEKVREELPEASINESWELQNGTSYDPNIFYGSKFHAKLFNKRVTFEVDRSLPEVQINQAFSNATQMAAFISMRYTVVENALTVALDELIMSTINNFTAEVIHASYEDEGLDTKSTAQAVNLFYLYKQKNPTTTLTAATCVEDPEFIRFAVYTMNKIRYRLGGMSKVYNLAHSEKFTPEDELHFVVLADFIEAANVYLQSDTYHNELTALKNFDKVAYWQGSGMGYEWNEITKIDVKTASNNVVTATGIIGVMFDRDALGVSNLYRRTKTEYVSKAEFFNNFHKVDAGYFNDLDENFVVFFVA